MEIIFDPKCETKGKNNRILHLGLIPMLMKALESNFSSMGNNCFDPIGSKYKYFGYELTK
jgi:hypothetical protein